ncbi:MAG TPA: DUF5916 domain-containing protein, partial [Bryobacteraceae bacterium]
MRRGSSARHSWGSMPGVLIAALAAGCLPQSLAAGTSMVEGIDYVSGPDRVQLTVHLSQPVPFTSGRLAGPERVYLDLPHTSASRPEALPVVPENDAVLARVHFEQAGDGTLRVVLDLKSEAGFSAVQLQSPPRLLLILRPKQIPPPKSLEAPAVTPGLVETPFPLTRPAAPPAAVLPAKTQASAPPVVEATRQLTIPRVAHPPKIEDFLHGVPEQPGVPVTDFRQRQPGDGAPVSRPTSAWLSYDDHNLYVVFVCKEDPAKVRARLAKREDIADDDQVAVYFDTFRDGRHAYVFTVNPLGIQADAIFTEGQDPDGRFDTVWSSEGRLTADGYVAWMSIPFKSVRFANDPAQTWNIALKRTIPRNGESSYWPYITNRTSGTLQQMAQLNGLSEISPGRNIQLIPYGTLTHDRRLSNLPPLTTQNDARAGMDAKAVLGNALTLDVTLNPDFSQVESDDPQVTVNQRYEVVFPEKRPFFLENASYFQTPINLFFSRRIADPEFGAKLTGKLAKWDLGVLASDDRAPGEGLSAGDPLLGSRAADGVFSLRRELGNQSTIGLFAATQDFGSNSNRVLSLDTRLRLSPTWFFSGQAVHSFDRVSGGGKSQGSAYDADLLHSGRFFTYEGNYTDYTPDFKARLGYIKRVDIRRTEHYASYLWRPEGSRI